MNALKTRHPERDWVNEKVEKGITDKFRPMAKETIHKNMNEFMRMVDPEILDNLPSLNSVNKELNFGNRGSYNPITRTIFYSSGEEFDKDNHFHELAHWLHFNAEDAKRRSLAIISRRGSRARKRGAFCAVLMVIPTILHRHLNDGMIMPGKFMGGNPLTACLTEWRCLHATFKNWLCLQMSSFDIGMIQETANITGAWRF